MVEKKEIGETSYFGAVDVTGSTLTKERVFGPENINNASPATLAFSQGETNGRVLKEIFIEDSAPGSKPNFSEVDVIIANQTVGTIVMAEDPHYYFKNRELDNKSFGVREVQLQPNATFGSSTVCVIAEYFYK